MFGAKVGKAGEVGGGCGGGGEGRGGEGRWGGGGEFGEDPSDH